MKAIKRSNLPATLPLMEALITRIALDHWHFSAGWYLAWWWFWGVMCVLALILAMLQDQVDIFRLHP